MAEHGDLLRVTAVAVAIGLLFLTGIGLVPVVVVGLLLALTLWAIAAATHRAEVRS